jgi:hypothetical protein
VQLNQVDNAIRETLASGSGGSKIAVSLAAVAQRETAQKQVNVIERLIKNLKESVPVAGEPETAAHFRRMSQNATDVELHLDLLSPRKWMFRRNSRYLPKDVAAKVKRNAKDYDYLREDWDKESAWARAMGSVVRTGESDVAINANGQIGRLDARDYAEHPENYSVYTISSSQLGIEAQRKNIPRAPRK